MLLRLTVKPRLKLSDEKKGCPNKMGQPYEKTT
jgi:hypothetical protein